MVCFYPIPESDRMINCSPLILNGNGYISPNCQRVAGSVCDVQCINTASVRLICETSGQWNPPTSSVPCLNQSPLNCPSIAINSPGLRMSGVCSPGQSNNACLFSCTPGYNLVGLQLIICQSNGLWTGSPPICQPIVQPTNECIQPVPSIENGGPFRGQCSPGRIGAECVFTCLSGYALVGQPSWLCLGDGSWSNSQPPQCVPITCPAPFAPENGQLSSNCTSTNRFNVGFWCLVRCANDYIPSDGRGLLECSESGQWSPQDPLNCVRVECPSLNVPGNSSLEGNCTPGQSGTICRMVCNSGFVAVGSIQVVCQTNGEWTGPLGSCEQRFCDPLLQVPNATSSGQCHAFNGQ